MKKTTIVLSLILTIVSCKKEVVKDYALKNEYIHHSNLNTESEIIKDWFKF